MKKLLPFAAICLLPLQAHAEGLFFKPSIGLDYQYTHANYESNVLGTGVDGDSLADDSIHGGNFHVGARVHKYLGFEAGYLWTADANKSNILNSGLESEVNFKGFNFDALGYIPVDSAGKFEIIGTVGVSHLRAELNIPTIGSSHETETKGRIGAGAQYWLTDHINVRGIVRYQDADFGNTVSNLVTANLGLNFQF